MFSCHTRQWKFHFSHGYFGVKYLKLLSKNLIQKIQTIEHGLGVVELK